MKKILAVLFLIALSTLGFKQPAKQPDKISPVMYYDKDKHILYAKSIDHFTYGLDSCLHQIKINEGITTYYFVLYDMSIELVITKYDE